MHKQGPSANLQLRQKREWREKGALWWSPYVSVSGHSMSRRGSQAGRIWCYFFVAFSILLMMTEKNFVSSIIIVVD